MIEQTFKRKPTVGLLTLALGVLFIYYGISHDEYNFIPPIFKFISGGLAIIYAIWQFATPYVIINDSTILVKKDVFSTKTFDKKQMDGITVYDDEIELKSGIDTIKIKLKVLGSEDRELLSREIDKIRKKEE